jgi:hypothetical protein
MKEPLDKGKEIKEPLDKGKDSLLKNKAKK